MANRFSVLGDGAWGTALAVLLAQDPGKRVVLWSARPENGQILRDRRENVRLLPGVRIPEAIELTTDLDRALHGADLAVAAIPAVYLRDTMTRARGLLPPDLPVVSVAKGLERDTFLRPTEILGQVAGCTRLVVLSGPSHAEEVSRGLPTSLVAASADLDLVRWVQQCFNTDRLRVYTSLDVAGVELAGALKNVIGLAAGACDGLGFGDNAKAALMTRGLVEMARFGVAHGGEHQTFFGIAGLGDLITTCVSRHGRNRLVGERLARGEPLRQILDRTPMVAEGVYTARSVYERAARMGLDMPITTEVYRVLYEGKSFLAAVDELMQRVPKFEQLY